MTLPSVSPPALNAFYDVIQSEGLGPGPARMAFFLSHVFEGVEFQDRRLLDIGGGVGLYSCYAACRGARDVVCLEPEAAGGATGSRARFERLKTRLNLGPAVTMIPSTFQAYSAADHAFDIILLYNSINHLDEAACQRLGFDAAARALYRGLFERVAALSAPGATLVVCDCARRNFFGDLGLPAPMARDIEWGKHQDPSLWVRLLSEAGFTAPRLAWTPLGRMGRIGRLLTGNRAIAYFLASHFRLRMTKA